MPFTRMSSSIVVAVTRANGVSVGMLGERLKKARTDKHLSQAALAKQIGVTRNAISVWESGGEAKPENLRKAAVILDVDYNWLATGRVATSRVVPGLALYGEIAAGVWSEVSDNQDPEVERVPVAPDPDYPAHAQFALRVRGNSVDKIAKDGTILACVDIHEGGVDIRDGDLVCVERRRGSLVETTVKRVRKGAKSLELWPESDDPAHQKPIPFERGKDIEGVTIRALVVGVYTQVKRGR
jgi:transcriptional regulator with XRE-family HTH domain